MKKLFLFFAFLFMASPLMAQPVSWWSTFSGNQLLLGNSNNPLISLAPGSSGQVLVSGGAGVAPSWANPAGTRLTLDSTNSDTGTIAWGANVSYRIQYNGKGSYTIAAPTYAQDGDRIMIISLAADTMTITCSTDGFNVKGSSGTVKTGGAIGDNIWLEAVDQHIIVLPSTNATVN